MSTAPTYEQRRTMYAALQSTERVTSVSSRWILGRRREAHIVQARHIVMWIVREFTDASLPTIATMFGRLDHTTVLHAHRRTTKKIGESESLQRTVAHILALMARSEEEGRTALVA